MLSEKTPIWEWHWVGSVPQVRPPLANLGGCIRYQPRSGGRKPFCSQVGVQEQDANLATCLLPT